ncbi:MAG: IS1595 family transposase [Pseudomonadota bacterium]
MYPDFSPKMVGAICGGRARSVHVRSLTTNSVGAILRQNVIRKTTKLMTDKANIYKAVGREFFTHESVDHGKYEWSRGTVHTNTIEGFFSIFKRGMRGVYQHCKEKHLHRYLAEFDFRYSNRQAQSIGDTERADIALTSIVGKRLTYETARIQ